MPTVTRRPAAAAGGNGRHADATRRSRRRVHGRYRWRTNLRGVLPLALARLVPKGRENCGDHEWYRADDTTDRCYHCEVGVRPHEPLPRRDNRELVSLLERDAHRSPAGAQALEQVRAGQHE